MQISRTEIQQSPIYENIASVSGKIITINEAQSHRRLQKLFVAKLVKGLAEILDCSKNIS